MSRVFTRSDQLSNRIFDVKLPIQEWKVLFAVNGEMDTTSLASFLELPQPDVERALKKLESIQLIIPVNAKEAQTFEQSFEEAPAPSVEEAEEIPDEVPAPTEEDQEIMDFPQDKEEFLEDFLQEKEETETAEETPEEEIEFPAADEKEGDTSDEEFDRLIGDLFNEDEVSEKETETAEQDFPTDEFPEDTETDTEEPLQETDEETAQTKPGTEKSDDEEFDFGSLFQEDLAETEQSLTDLMGELEQEIAEDEVAIGKEEEPPAEKAPQPTKTLLVVDDSVVIRKMVEIALENENSHIVSVATGKEAMQFIDEQDPDLVILDIMLPDVNGLDILKAIKASKSIPVVMLSAKDTPRETSKAKELGADDFIPKPFKDEELVTKIKELVGE